MSRLPSVILIDKILARSISLGPEEGGADKYLYMAQLHEGREALDFYTKGLVLLKKQLENGFDATKREAAALMQRLCMAYCSVGELFLTDLCFEEDAEQRCQVGRSVGSKSKVSLSRPPIVTVRCGAVMPTFGDAGLFR